ncbi:hypothetical protein BC941DRAFT_454843 [Chlamydoabsidia padenii]|nr:hypothetical protein BC941DRAFT_454843 [Chlamydoabsidia padenii]
MKPLPLELLYLIIDQVIESELQHYHHVFAPSTVSTTGQLLVTNHTIAQYIKQQDGFHRLRLWRLLNRIPRQFEPVQIAVGTMDAFTLLSMDMSTETAASRVETFLVLQEKTPPSRTYYAHDPHLICSRKQQQQQPSLALFSLDTFLRHVLWYASHHDASIWLWKKSARFFRGDNLDLLLQQRFKYILDTPRHALIAWDRPCQLKVTENVLNSNVELFSKLLPSF